jgi:hypothetical protein
VPFRGGGWSSGALSGVFAVGLNNARGDVFPDVGARPAFVS